MKYLFPLILLGILFTSCDDTVDPYDRGDSLSETTIEVLSNIDTVYQLAIVEEKVYLLQDSLVVHVGHLTTNTHIAHLPLGFLFLLTIAASLGIVALFLD